MIAKVLSPKSFGETIRYLARGPSSETERVAWSVTRNLPTDDVYAAAKYMRATADANVRVGQATYHVMVSFDPSDKPTDEMMKDVGQRVLRALELDRHQAVIVAHRDRAHAHMHIVVNRVHPETGRVWNRWQDKPRIDRTLAEVEVELGLKVVPGHRNHREVPRELPDELSRRRQGLSRELDPARGGSTMDEMDAHRVRRTGTSAGGGPADVDAAIAASPRVAAAFAAVEAYARADHAARELDWASDRRLRMAAIAVELEASVTRAENRSRAFDRALADTYRNPNSARARFESVADTSGIDRAVATMREHAADFGDLQAQSRGKLAALIGPDDYSAAITAAQRAAILGREAIEGERTLAEQARAARLERLDAAWLDRLGMIYKDPRNAAREIIEQARERLDGASGVARILRDRPETFGELRLAPGPDETPARRHAQDAAAALADASRVTGTRLALYSPMSQREAAVAIDLGADRARELESARALTATRAERSSASFDRALVAVYGDDARNARRAFEAIAQADGIRSAASQLRETPGTMGAIRETLADRPTELEARAHTAARRGVTALEAGQDLAALSARIRSEQLDAAVNRAVGALYRDLTDARRRYDMLAAAHGVDGANERLSRRPELLGRLNAELVPGADVSDRIRALRSAGSALYGEAALVEAEVAIAHRVANQATSAEAGLRKAISETGTPEIHVSRARRALDELPLDERRRVTEVAAQRAPHSDLRPIAMEATRQAIRYLTSDGN